MPIIHFDTTRLVLVRPLSVGGAGRQQKCLNLPFLAAGAFRKGRGRAASPSPFPSNTHNSFLDSPLLIPPFSPPPPPRLFNLLFLPHAEMRRGGGGESAAVRRSCYRHRSITYMPSGGRGGRGKPLEGNFGQGDPPPPQHFYTRRAHKNPFFLLLRRRPIHSPIQTERTGKKAATPPESPKRKDH